MLNSSLSRCLLCVFSLLLWAANAPAQLQIPPPLPDSSAVPPPDPASLPPPPSLEWAPLPPRAPAEEEPSNTVPPPGDLSVPAPQPEAVLPPAPVPDIAAFIPGQSSSSPVDGRASGVEVWREESASPQEPVRQGARFDQAYVAGIDLVSVRILFDPRAAGKTVIVKPGPGVTVDPPETEFRVGPTGDCVVSVAVNGTYLRSYISVYCDGLRTTLPLSRASLATVEAQEALTEGK
jgi:hypothetical protein